MKGGIASASPPMAAAAVSGYGGAFDPIDSHTEWVEGRVHQTGFKAVFTPNTEAPHRSGANAYDVDFTSAEEGENANPTYAAVTSRSYHPGAVQALYMDGSSIRSPIRSNAPSGAPSALAPVAKPFPLHNPLSRAI